MGALRKGRRTGMLGPHRWAALLCTQRFTLSSRSGGCCSQVGGAMNNGMSASWCHPNRLRLAGKLWYASPFEGHAVCVDPSDGREVGHSLLDTTVKGAGKPCASACNGGWHACGIANLCRQ